MTYDLFTGLFTVDETTTLLALQTKNAPKLTSEETAFLEHLSQGLRPLYSWEAAKERLARTRLHLFYYSGFLRKPLEEAEKEIKNFLDPTRNYLPFSQDKDSFLKGVWTPAFSKACGDGRGSPLITLEELFVGGGYAFENKPLLPLEDVFVLAQEQEFLWERQEEALKFFILECHELMGLKWPGLSKDEVLQKIFPNAQGLALTSYAYFLETHYNGQMLLKRVQEEQQALEAPVSC